MLHTVQVPRGDVFSADVSCGIPKLLYIFEERDFIYPEGVRPIGSVNYPVVEADCSGSLTRLGA